MLASGSVAMERPTGAAVRLMTDNNQSNDADSSNNSNNNQPVLETISSRPQHRSLSHGNNIKQPASPMISRQVKASVKASHGFHLINNNGGGAIEGNGGDTLPQFSLMSAADLNGAAAFNKYPAPVFVKTVASARAQRLRRGLAEGAARRTRVNNDLRDELTRIIQFTTERQLHQQIQQQQFQQHQQLQRNRSANKTKGPVAISRENRSIRTPDGNKKGGPDESKEFKYPEDYIWPSSSTISGAEWRERTNLNLITPPNSAVASTVRSGRFIESEVSSHASAVENWPLSHLPAAASSKNNSSSNNNNSNAPAVSHPTTPTPGRARQILLGTSAASSLPANNSTSNSNSNHSKLKKSLSLSNSTTNLAHNNNNNSNNTATGSNGGGEQQQQTAVAPRRRRFIACVVSQNFALRLLETTEQQPANAAGFSRGRLRQSKSYVNTKQQ